MIKVIKNGLVITMDESRKNKIEKLDVVISDDKIISLEENYFGNYDVLIDACGKVVMPGLINCHTHLGMSIFRATNDNLCLSDWLNKKIWPIENKLSDEDIYYSTLVSCIEMIKTGTTCFNDMYFGYKGFMKAINETKVRGMVSRCLMGNMDDDSMKRIDEFRDLIDSYKGPLISFSVAPHALYTCDSDYLRECFLLSSSYNLPIHMHFCENENEVQDIVKSYGKKPGFVLKDLDFYSRKLILAHGVCISSEELDLFGDNVSIVTNPVSNLNLGCGFCDIVKYISRGINVCLGTDGQGSGNNLNMFRHMSIVGDLQKGLYKDPTVISSYDVLKMATINGARALGLDDKIGSIERGKCADIIILDLNDICVYPAPDLINQIVHNCVSCVNTVMINGDILVNNGEFLLDIDFDDLKSKIDDIFSSLGKE